MNFKILILNIIYSSLVFAVNSKELHQPVDVSKKNVATQESIIELQGKTFRKIQYEKDIYYLEMIDASAVNEAYRLMCSRGHDEKLPMQVKAGVKITKRSQFIVEGLRQYCLETKDAKREIAVDARIVGGLQLNLDKEYSKDMASKESFFKNKKLIVTPIDGLVFKADW